MFRRRAFLLYSGAVSRWAPGKPFGFIRDDEDGGTYFCHKDDLINRHDEVLDALPTGFRVDFETASYEGRTKAVNITLPGGRPITIKAVGSTKIGGDATKQSIDDLRKLSGALDRLSNRSASIYSTESSLYRMIVTLAHKQEVKPLEFDDFRATMAALFVDVNKERQEQREANRLKRQAAAADEGGDDDDDDKDGAGGGDAPRVAKATSPLVDEF